MSTIEQQQPPAKDGTSPFTFFSEVVDLSVKMVSLGTAMFPGYPQPLRAAFSTVRDNGFASSIWTFVEHSGTHVDSPSHFFEAPAPSIDEVPLDRYVGHGLVLDFSKNKSPRSQISRADIVAKLQDMKVRDRVGKGWILLFYTGYTAKSKTTEWLDYPELSSDASSYVAELGVNAIGIDAPGPDREPFPAHKILLPKMISIYENLANLDKVLGKDFVFVGVPIALKDGSASPCRAIAFVIS